MFVVTRRLSKLSKLLFSLLPNLGILLFDFLVLYLFIVEVFLGFDFVVLGPLHLLLNLVNHFHLVGHSFSPELLSIIELYFPLAQFLFQLLDIVIVGIVYPHVVLLLLLQQIALSFGLEFSHLILRQLFREVNKGSGALVCVRPSQFFLQLYDASLLDFNVVVLELKVETFLPQCFVLLLKKGL